MAQAASAASDIDVIGSVDIGTSSFEDVPGGVLPSGWFVPEPDLSRGFEAAVTAESTTDGSKSLQLQAPESDLRNPERPGTVMMAIPAAPYRGALIRLSADVRTSGPACSAALWLRVDKGRSTAAFFDNMADRPIRNANWERHAIIGHVVEDAELIQFGLNLSGMGAAWVDSIQIDIISDRANEPPRPLTDRGLENLVAFTNLYGYVRLFHPDDGSARANWDHLAIEGVARVEPCLETQALVDSLDVVFTPVGPAIDIFIGDSGPPVPQRSEEVPLGADHLVEWKSFGLQLGPSDGVYRRWRSPVPVLPSFQEPTSPRLWRRPIGDGIETIVPLTVWADSTGRTVPHTQIPRAPSRDQVGRGGRPAPPPPPTVIPGKPVGFRPNCNDRATRLAAVVSAWSTLQHFYPYFDIAECDWELELRKTLRQAAVDPDRDAFLHTLRAMLQCLHDGHADIHPFYIERPGALPLTWRWIEGELVVTNVLIPANGPQGSMPAPGDVVLSVDGQPVTAATDSLGQWISSSTDRWRRYKACDQLKRGPIGSKVELRIERPGTNSPVSIRVQRIAREESERTFLESRPVLSEPAPEIFYVDLTRLNDRAFDRLLPEIAEAKGLVFDLRGYPERLGNRALSHLIHESVTSLEWQVPTPRYPDRHQLSFRPTRWTLDPAPEPFSVPTAFLLDERAMSKAETYLSFIESAGTSALIGTASAGTTGNMTRVALPGGFRLTFTGMRVSKRDGTEFHGVGVRPTIVVQPTRASALAGRDAVLDAAVQWVSSR